ncbi:hypothetical protein V6O07_11310, partial [Arthrospira platensis SPKY2]
MTDIIDNIDELIALTEKKVALLRDLRRCLMLAALIGVEPKDIKGKISAGLHVHGTSQVAPWRNYEFYVRLDGVEVYRKPLLSVPH